MDTDTRFDAVISVAIRWDLQAAIFIVHSVVFSHNSLFFHTQNVGCYLGPRISSSLSSARRSRVRMSSAVLVQVKGFGFVLCCPR